VEVTEILDRISCLPMMAEHRVVVVRDVQHLPAGDRRKLLEHGIPARRKKQLDQSESMILEQLKRLKCASLDRQDEKDLRRQIEDLLGKREALIEKTEWAFTDTCLILTADDVKYDKFFKHIHRPGKCEPGVEARKLKKSDSELTSWHSFFAHRAICQVQFRALWEREIPPWIKQQVKHYGKTVTPQAVQLLSDSIGNDLVAMDNELRKLAIYVGERSAIELSDVEAVVGEFRTRTVFEFCDAVGTGDAAASMALLTRLLEAGVSPFHIMGALRWHLCRLTAVRAMSQKKKPLGAMARELHIWRGHLEKCLQQSRRFDERKLSQAFEYLYRTELGLKTGAMKPQMAMALLVCRICQPKEEAADAGISS
jgi:DNA polymerase III delta subunit